MSDYSKTTNFTAKDSLPSGNAGKIVKGAEIDVEFTAIQTAVNSKANLASPALTGVPTAPTAAAGTNTTQIATTAHVFAERSNSATLTNKTLTAPILGTPVSGTLTNCTGLPATAVINTPAGTISAATVQAAINELDTEKAALSGATFTGGVGIGASISSNMVSVGGIHTSTATGSRSYGNSISVPSTNTAWHIGYHSESTTAAAAFTLGELSHFKAQPITFGAGSSVTTQYGFVADSSLTGATNNYGFQGSIAAGTGRYNLYMSGTAQNYLAGELSIGIATSTSSQLTLAASTTAKSSLRITHGAAPTAPVNGDMWSTTAGLFIRINGVTKTVTLT